MKYSVFLGFMLEFNEKLKFSKSFREEESVVPIL